QEVSQLVAAAREPDATEPSGPERTLVEQRMAADRAIGVHAALAAANAFNPLPGLDIGIDLGILSSLARSLAAIYELGEDRFEDVERHLQSDVVALNVLQLSAESLTPLVVRKALATTLPQLGLELVARETTKWVPVAGSAVAAGIGYRMFQRFGAHL